MIITVTLNPAMDRTVTLDTLVVGEVNRVSQGRSDPGGKGINVSRVLRELDTESLAMGFVAGSIGRFIEASLNEAGIRDDFIHTPGQTRTNLSVFESALKRETNIYEPGPATEARFAGELRARLKRCLRPGDWVVLAGSMPPGIDLDTYADLIGLAKERGCFPVLDSDGEALLRGVEALPYLVKPNRIELERLIGRALTGEREILAAAQQLRDKGIEYVVVSLGPDGTIAVTSAGNWRGFAPRVDVRNTVGAGDSLVAGLVRELARDGSFVSGLRLGMAAGAATAMNPGTMLCRKADVQRLLPEVRIEAI